MKNNKPRSIRRNASLHTVLMIVLLLAGIQKTAQAQLQFANLGDYKLENGQIIEDCIIGYRTFGQLNADRSNAILFPTWYGGTSESLLSYIGEDQMLDSTRYYVIIVDAFGNGVSSSPSTSTPQPGKSFPEFSIRDMVNAQHMFVTEKLGLDHLYAVTGISMGGMQTYQWMASYPKFFDRAAPIVGSPRLTSYDGLVFELFQRIMHLCGTEDCPEVTTTALMLEYVLGFTPAYRAQETSATALPALITAIEEEARHYHLYDLLSQMRAISRYDLGDSFYTTPTAGEEHLTPQALIIVAEQDHLLLPTTTAAFAQATGSRIITLDTDCGHYAFACEQERISAAVRSFLK